MPFSENNNIFIFSKKLKALLAIFSFYLFLSGCLHSHTIKPMPDNLPQTLKIVSKKNNICNVAIAVIKNRKLVSTDTATGCTTAQNQNSESIFQAASLSKPVFAYAVMTLVAEGKLNLDTPVIHYLPQGYRHQFDPLKSEPSELIINPHLQMITVRMALNHTSGLPNWSSGPLNFHSTPGTKWNYSGEGYLLIQRAVEAVTGMPLNQFMQQKVFKPLNMNHSDYVWNETVSQNLLSGTKANGKARIGIPLKTPVSAFSLYTTAADYGKFLETILNDQKLLQNIIEASVIVEPKLNLSWGLGWGIETAKDNTYIWHWGNNPGYRAFVMASMDTGNGFVIFTNSDNGLRLAEPIANQILPNEHKIFEFSMLDDDVINILCNSLRLCF